MRDIGILLIYHGGDLGSPFKGTTYHVSILCSVPIFQRCFHILIRSPTSGLNINVQLSPTTVADVANVDFDAQK